EKITVPAIDVGETKIVAASPLLTLRERAAKESWRGAAFEDLSFDAAGALVLRGLAADAQQKQKIKAAPEAAWRKEGAPAEKEEVSCGPESMPEQDVRYLARRLQEKFAAAGLPYRRTRLDLSEFRYHQKDKEEPALRLHVKGVCLGPDSLEKDLRARV